MLEFAKDMKLQVILGVQFLTVNGHYIAFNTADLLNWTATNGYNVMHACIYACLHYVINVCMHAVIRGGGWRGDGTDW